MNDLLDSQTFAEIKKFEDFCYRKGFREGIFWGLLLGSAIAVVLLWKW